MHVTRSYRIFELVNRPMVSKLENYNLRTMIVTMPANKKSISFQSKNFLAENKFDRKFDVPNTKENMSLKFMER